MHIRTYCTYSSPILIIIIFIIIITTYLLININKNYPSSLDPPYLYIMPHTPYTQLGHCSVLPGGPFDPFARESTEKGERESPAERPDKRRAPPDA